MNFNKQYGKYFLQHATKRDLEEINYSNLLHLHDYQRQQIHEQAYELVSISWQGGKCTKKFYYIA